MATLDGDGGGCYSAGQGVASCGSLDNSLGY